MGEMTEPIKKKRGENKGGNVGEGCWEVNICEFILFCGKHEKSVQQTIK